MKKYINLLIKLILLVLIWHAIAYGDLPQYMNKGMNLRVSGYPLLAILTFVVWKFLSRKRKIEYPYFIDIALTSVITFDLAGNTFDFYDSIWWWDDAMHLVMSVPWVLVFGYLIRNKIQTTWIMAGLVIAYGGVSNILWETAEYISFVQDHPVESLSAYRDTIGDLVLSLIGTIIGGIIAARVFVSSKSKT